MIKKITLSLIAMTFSLQTFGNSNIFTDEDFGKAEFKKASKDLVSAFAHTTNSGGSSLGSIWGVEVGIVAGGLDAKNIREVAEEVSGSSAPDELKFLPYAGIIAGVSLPFGIGGELSLIPKTDIDDASFSNQSIALKWSITDMIPLVGSFSPLKITTRFAYGSTDLNASFSASGNSTETVDFSIKNTEIGVTAGFNLFLIEPYIGLSSVSSDSDLNASTNNTSIPVQFRERNFDTSLSGTRTILGVLFKLPLLRFGLEMSNMQSTNRYTAKLSLKI